VEPRETDFYTDTAMLGQKAQVTEDNGDLYIEGWAADIAKDDQDETFSFDALKAGAEAFVASGNMPLLYHHKPDLQLGEIIDFEARQDGERSGIWMKARVDGEVRAHPALGAVYGQIKRGSMKGLSVAGRFFTEP
jgi:phage head maturation protease